MRTIALWTRIPVAGVVVEFHTGDGKWEAAATNSDGIASTQADEALGDSDVRFTADGYQPYQQHVVWLHIPRDAGYPRPLNHQLSLGEGGLPLAVPLHSMWTGGARMPDIAIAANGVDFIDPATGYRVCIPAMDAFDAYRIFRDQGPHGLDDFIDEGIELGYRAFRVLMMGSRAQNGTLQLDPAESGYYDDVPKFGAYINGKGAWAMPVAYADNQDIKATVEHGPRLAAAFGLTKMLYSYWNEWSKNMSDFNPGKLPELGLPFWSRGSDVGDAFPYLPPGTCVEFHLRRDLWKGMLDTVASAVNIQYERGIRRPLWYDEPARMGTDGSDPAYADPDLCEQMARGMSVRAAVVVFHCRTGQLCVPMDAGTKACAVAFRRGLDLGR